MLASAMHVTLFGVAYDSHIRNLAFRLNTHDFAALSRAVQITRELHTSRH